MLQTEHVAHPVGLVEADIEAVEVDLEARAEAEVPAFADVAVALARRAEIGLAEQLENARLSGAGAEMPVPQIAEETGR